MEHQIPYNNHSQGKKILQLQQQPQMYYSYEYKRGIHKGKKMDKSDNILPK